MLFNKLTKNYDYLTLVQGIRDLFWLPIEQYQKDGRIVRGLQRGANSFTTSTAMAALELTSRLVHAIQSTAETAYDMVSPGPSVRRKTKGQKGRRKRYSQPLDIREGMANAYTLVQEVRDYFNISWSLMNNARGRGKAWSNYAIR